jgi:hypothetical protein
VAEVEHFGTGEVPFHQGQRFGAEGRHARTRDGDVEGNDLAFLLDAVADGMAQAPQRLGLVDHGIDDGIVEMAFQPGHEELVEIEVLAGRRRRTQLHQQGIVR